MGTLVTRLNDAIAAVCPIDGVAIGDPADKATWRIDCGPAATDAEKAAAQTALVAFVIDPPPDLPAYAANKRWLVETGGVTVAGAHIQTDRDSQAMITGAYAYAQANPSATINYKAEGGFVTLTAAQMTAIGLAVGAHVQACFAAEAAIDADIAAGTITTTAQIDADARWPSNA